MRLRAEHIEHFYDQEHILHDINLEIKSSCITAIIGESGSGKTTLLAILSSLLKASSGSVYYDDISLEAIKNIDEFRKKNIGFVFQFHYLINYLSIEENITLNALDATKCSALLKALGIEHLASRYDDEISGGERQRAAIARALINSPTFVFADEPTGNLDTKNAIAVFELFSNFKDTGFVVATHDKKIIDYADTIIEMEDGFVKNIYTK